MTADIHTRSYYCERPGCIRAQRDELRDRLEAVLAQRPAAPSNARGEWVLVPREPTEAMISHGEEWEYSTISNGPAMARQLYAAMLAAAPSPAAAPQQPAAVDDQDAQVAEVEALRAEVERLRADRDSWEQQASDRVADWHAEHLRAERLAEALKEIRSRSSIDLAMRSDQFELTARLGDIHQIACAALAQEADRG